MKIAICIPCHGDPKLGFAMSLARLAAHSVSHGLKIGIQDGSSANLPWLRCDLVKAVLPLEPDYIFWLDADHIFPPDSLIRLLAHDKPVVGVNQPTRSNPECPTAAVGPMERIVTTEDLAKRGVLRRVESMGLAMCLMRTEIFARLDKPWFASEPTEDGEQFIGEDFYFFQKLKAAGIPAFVDHGLSWDVGHISQTVLTNAGTKGVRRADIDLPAAGAA